MPSDEGSIAASGPFRFLVGPERKEYMMHAELVASMSRPLRALLNSGMEESIKGVVEWPEVEESTFERFFQFAYTGDFDWEEPEQPHENPDPDDVFKEGEPVMSPEEAAFYAAFTKKPRLWETFIQLGMPSHRRPGRKYPPIEQDPALDFTRVFQTYAQLYVLADEKDIQDLADLAFDKLHHTLLHFNLQENRVGDIALLADYCFENTCDKGGEQDKMRRLICLFTACNLETLWPSPDFQRVFAKHGDFSIGIMGMVLSRLD